MRQFPIKTRKRQLPASCTCISTGFMWLTTGILNQRLTAGSWSRVLVLAFLIVSFSLPKTLAEEKLELKDFDYWASLCKLLGSEKKYEEAIAACNEAIALKPAAPDVWVIRTEILLEQGKYSEALVSAERTLRLKPKYSLAIADRCQALFKLGKYAEAIAACDLALRSDGDWGDNTAVLAWYTKGIAQSNLKKFAEAVTSFNSALEINPQDPLTLVGNCQALSQLGRLTEAIAACDLALKSESSWGNSSPAIAWYSKGLAQKRNRQIEEAIASFDQAIALNPKDAEMWLEHGRALSLIGKVDQATVSYEFAVKLSPNYSLALASQAANLNKLNTKETYQKAVEAADKALQGDNRWGDSSPALAWESRGIAQAGLGQYEEGLASLDRAIGLNANSADIWNNRAATLWYLGRYTDAIASSDRSTKINPKYAQAWFNKGRILRTLERYREALAAYDKALENIASLTDNSQVANIWANRSVVLWHLSRNREALAAADRAIGINPELSQGWYNRGVVLLDLKRYNEAITAYNRANLLTPNNPSILAGKGIALLKLGRLQDAIATFDETLKVDPANSLALANKTIAEQRLQERLEREKPKFPTAAPTQGK
ncbi:tetratricopeptide repeat domain protein [Cylindrospermum sp. NIES-4074]|nr:tetratricopeptide repeat domain protein [Cylindrospermum sp. NIES-4074]